MSEVVRPTPPDYIDGEALLEWERVVDELIEIGGLNRVDRVNIAAYVMLWAIHRDAARHVTMFGPTHTLPNGYRQPTPEYDIMMKTQQQIRAWMKEFMATSRSRPRGTAAAVGGGELDI